MFSRAFKYVSELSFERGERVSVTDTGYKLKPNFNLSLLLFHLLVEVLRYFGHKTHIINLILSLYSCSVVCQYPV